MISNAVITGGTFTQVVGSAKDPFERLQAEVSPGAFHNSGQRFDPPKCHPNTRVAVLQRIMDWIMNLDPEARNATLMWLYGPAGSGKSAIEQTIAERCYAAKLLLASFFFSRTDPSRNTARPLIATLAYQIALNLPQSRAYITAAVEHNPLIFELSLETQLISLIIEPLGQLAGSGSLHGEDPPRLVIIDGLDECQNSDLQHNILLAISNGLRQCHFPILFLIASRPEPMITAFFSLRRVTPQLTTLALDDTYLPDEDIELFLTDKFEEIKETHPLHRYIPVSWPGGGIVDKLVKKSSGQFIFASTTIKFISSIRHRPTDRLEVVLGIRPTHRETPFTELDALYSHIFSSLENVDMVLHILGLQILSGNLFLLSNNGADLEDFFGLNPGDLSMILGEIDSILIVNASEHSGIRILHASLKDYLCDVTRSGKFYLNPPSKHAEYAHLHFLSMRRRQQNYHHDSHSELPINSLRDKHPESTNSSLTTVRWDQDEGNTSDTETVSDQLDLSPYQLPVNNLRELLLHLPLAIPTSELQEDILAFSFVGWIIEGQSPWATHGVMEWMTDFLLCIKSLPWHNAENMYRNALRSFDQFLMKRLDICYSHRHLTFLVMFTNLLRSDEKPSFLDMNWHRSRGDDGLHLLMLLPTYRNVFVEFLRDKDRSGEYAPNGHRYATATIYCLHTMFRIRPGPHVFLQYSASQTKLRRNAPWMWRKKQGSARINMVQRPTISESDTFRQWVPYLIESINKSSKSEELIAELRRAARLFGLIYSHGETKALKEAIQNYLARVSNEP